MAAAVLQDREWTLRITAAVITSYAHADCVNLQVCEVMRSGSILSRSRGLPNCLSRHMTRSSRF
jgi:hypothetical protein